MTEPQALSHKRPAALDRFFYGAPYYPEHWDEATRELDAERMAAAGFNCVRMAEFAWDLMEPVEGVFNFDLFDETIARLGERGIFTILCTPTAAPPRWLTLAHPEVLRVNAEGLAMQHGSRQHACHSSPLFREYSRHITRAMAEHYRDNPHVAGWQTDNEFNCHFSECHCPSCQEAFREFLKAKHGNIDSLNAAWGNAFWALTYRDFDEICTPKPGRPAFANPAQLLDYYRYISWSVTRFQHDQVEILRRVQPRWFITHNTIGGHIDYRGEFTRDLDFMGVDIYPFFNHDPAARPFSQAFSLDHARAWSGNFMIPEQQSGPGGQGGYFHDNPEPGEIRRMAYTSIARGADSLLFFRWRTCRFGAEEYWCGILDHDSVPRRRYEEVKGLGEELKTIGPEILGTHVHVDVGIAAADQAIYDSHGTLSLGLPAPWESAATLHGFFMERGFAAGCVHPSDDLGGLKVYIIPHWPIFDPAWMANLHRFVEGGGVLIVGARTASKDLNNNVIAETLPGVLGELAGVRVAEYGRQNVPEKRPLKLRLAHAEAPTALWYEALDLAAGTEALAHWKGRHLTGQPAISLRKVGKGAVIYAGTYLTRDLAAALLPEIEKHSGLMPLWPAAPAGVQVVRRQDGAKRLWFFINDSDAPATVNKLPKGLDLMTGQPAAGRLTLERNGVALIREVLA